MERADHFRIYASMNREKILEMLKAHSNGMKELSLSLAIIENGRIQCYYYNGESLTEKVPRLIYEIGSVTKTFTAALLMKMISEGMLNLSDSIDRYLPEVQWPDQTFVPTVLQLVTHTSGIGNDIECASEEARADLEDRLSKFSGDFEDDCIYGYLDRNDYIETLRSIDWTDVRHDFQYSNIGVIILGIVMERASGVSYESMMERFIMEELSLSHTWLDIPSEFPAGYQLARPCGTDQTEKKHWIWNHRIGMAAGGIYSTLEDIVAYAKTYLNDAPTYLKNTHIRQLAYSEADHFGIAVSWIKEGNITWHNGATGCFHSFIGFNKKEKTAVVILENHHEVNDMSIDIIGKEIIKNKGR